MASPLTRRRPATASVQAAFDKYYTLDKAQISASLTDIAAFNTLAQDPASGDAASRAKLVAKAAELKQWMLVLLGSQDVGGGATGTVPATLSLSLGAAPAFGAFVPGVARDLHAPPRRPTSSRRPATRR